MFGYPVFFCFCFFVKNETGLPAFKLTKIEYLCNFKQDNSVTQIRKKYVVLTCLLLTPDIQEICIYW
jgi:hypothetical protein